MSLKSKLARNELTIGSWITLAHSGIAEIMTKVGGFDWLTIDMEHSVIELRDAQEMMQAMDLGGITPLVRLTSNDDNQIKRVMDAGAHGIVVPMVKNSEDAISDYCYCLEKLGPYGHYITINISSPNTPGLRDLQKRGQIEALVKSLQKKQNEFQNLIDKPIFFKISPDLNDEQLRDIALISLANNISGLIISNSTTERHPTLKSSNKNEIGGLSGKPLFIQSTVSLKKMFSLTNGQLTLIGVGGVSNGKECYEKMKAGANLIQIYTSLIFQGPKVVNKIKNELIDLIKIDGFSNVREIVGKEV